MVKAKILKTDEIEVEVAITHTLQGWKLIRDALKRGMEGGHWHCTVADFKGEISDIVLAIEKTVEAET